MANGIQLVLVLVFLFFLIFVAGKILFTPFKLLFKLLYNSLIGILLLWVANLLGTMAGFSLPINWLTVLITGFLGIPGLILLVVLRLLMGT